jgi:hypothetical protein
MVFQNDILAGASGTDVVYPIDQSIRFNRSDSAYLTRTPSSASNRRTFTLSFWWKMCTLPSTTSGGYRIIQAGSTEFGWSDTNNNLYLLDGGTIFQTSQVFRDPSAWQHIVLAVDTTDATAGNRIKLYINGSEVTNFASGPSVSLNFDFDINNTVAQNIGKEGANYIGAYVAEFHSVDGTQLDATSFGETNDNGVWIPKAYSGSYGTNGFYLKGQDSADLGNDSSGNGNDFTSSGLTSDDQVSDSPTLNFPVISPIDRQSGSNAVLSDGNLKFTNNNTATSVDARATFALPKGQGKWYFEMEADILGQSGVNREFIGIVSTEWRLDSGSGGDAFWTSADGFSFSTAGSKGNNGSLTSYGSAWSAGDIIGCAVDLDNNKIWWSINNTWQNSGNPATGTNAAFTSLSSDVTYAPAFAVDYGTGVSQIIANFGQTGGLTYTPPTGFSQIDSSTLPEPTIKDGSAYFQASLYTGNGTAIGSGGNAVTQSDNSVFQPDLVWIKERNDVTDHALYDAVRGATEDLVSNTTNAETTQSEGLTTFDSSGFTVGNLAKVNTNSDTYVAWQWLAGNGTSANGDGDISSTVSVNTTAGFSIVSYTGNGSASQTVGHGLGVTPTTVIIKPRSRADHWLVSNWESDVTAFTEKMKLNANEAASSSSNQITSGSSTTFTIGSDINVNGSGETYIAYVWSEVEGFSKLGTYTGNGSSDGPFLWCGFRPAFLIGKRTNTTGYWYMKDSVRGAYNVNAPLLYADLSNAEANDYNVDFVSNGVKIRDTDNSLNGSGSTIIFMAFAENPFGGNGVAPVPAR